MCLLVELVSRVGESDNRGNLAVGSSSARSVPKPHFACATAAHGRRAGIGTKSLRLADTIRADAIHRPGGTMRGGGDRC
ncbi:hypothetical protein DM992_23355 [Burkholderia sp. JP2-270]|nr:hypothetical protein DM992_23355 [Burkholderia sp. JP2-270]